MTKTTWAAVACLALLATAVPASADDWGFSFSYNSYPSYGGGSYYAAPNYYYAPSYSHRPYYYGGGDSGYGYYRDSSYHTYGYSGRADYYGQYEHGGGYHTGGIAQPYSADLHHGYHLNAQDGWHGGTHVGDH